MNPIPIALPLILNCINYILNRNLFSQKHYLHKNIAWITLSHPPICLQPIPPPTEAAAGNDVRHPLNVKKCCFTYESKDWLTFPIKTQNHKGRLKKYFRRPLWFCVFSDGLRRYPLLYPLFDSFGTQAQIVQKFFRIAVFGYGIGNTQK